MCILVALLSKTERQLHPILQAGSSALFQAQAWPQCMHGTNHQSWAHGTFAQLITALKNGNQMFVR
jgi:hypothetical protein